MPASNPFADPPVYEMAFIGSGISCTAILLQLLDRLEENNFSYSHPFSIAIIEKEGELWKGVPYGKRSSVNSLTITNLGEFVPVSEKTEFIDWLEQNQYRWMGELKANGDVAAREWIEKNYPLITGRRWLDMYIPRYLFGEYLREKISVKIETAQKKGKLRLRLIHALATDIEPSSIAAHKITARHNNGVYCAVHSEKVIVCIGSPPVKGIPGAREASGYAYINDAYQPSLPRSLELIQTTLSSMANRKDRNVLVLGSNASSLELVYLISNNPGLKKWLNKLVLISGSGTLPVRAEPQQEPEHEFAYMDLLMESRFTAGDLMMAVEKDIAHALDRGITIAPVYSRLSSLLVELLDRLETKEREKFHCIYGAEFSKLIRRAGAEYREAATSLEQEGKLALVKGSLLRIEEDSQKSGIAEMVYRVNEEPAEATYPLSFPVVVNCGGFEQLDIHSSSELIANLVARKLGEVNCTGRGFRVNENFEAGEGLYVMGPLLGGIFNSRCRLWHVENAKSIFHLAGLLVGELRQTLEQKTYDSL